MSEYVRIDVVRHTQKGITCYVGHLSAAESAKVTFADSFPPDPEAGRLGYQRMPNEKRAKAFANYLKTHDSGFMTPILLNSRQPVEFVPTDGQSDVGELRIHPGQMLAKIDGQHRGLGIERFLDDPAYPVPFMLFDQLGEEAEQQLFVDINREQKRVSMSHVLFIGGDDEHTDIALRLNDDDSSPWHHRINVIGATGTGRSVTLQGLKESLERLLSAGKVKQLEEDEKYEIARTFWDLVADTWPEAWENPRKHQLTKAVGLLGLGKSGSYLVADCINEDPSGSLFDKDRLKVLLAHAKSVNWDSKEGDFVGLGGKGGADVVSDHLDSFFYAADSDEASQ